MDDTLACVELLRTQLLPKSNMFAYGQVESPYGSGQFIKDLKEHFAKDDRGGRQRDPRPRTPSSGASRTFSARGSDGSMSKFALNTALPRYLRTEKERIEKVARAFGLDFFPTIFEILTYDQMNEIAAYGGFPAGTRTGASGWSTSSSPRATSTALSKIYEMVINNNSSRPTCSRATRWSTRAG